MNPIPYKNKIRVLHVLGTLGLGGVENWLMNVLRHIDREQIQMDFCCLSGIEGSHAAEARNLNSKVIPCKITKNLHSFNRKFAHILSSGEYDIVHSHVYLFNGYILRQAAKSGIQQRIAHGHTNPPAECQPYARRLYKKIMQQWLKKYTTLGLGISKAALPSLFGRQWREMKQLEVLYCGVDLSPFWSLPVDSNIREQLGIPDEDKIIGHLGRLTPAKNHKFFLKIAASIQQKRPDVRFLIVGDGPLRKELEELTLELELDNVLFIGDTNKVAPYLATMDLLLFPSLWEGLPLSVVEAQAADLHCLCSDIITDEVAILPGAVRFKDLHRSAEEWGQTCIELLDEPGIPAGKGVSFLAETSFSITNNVKCLTQIYCSGNQAVREG